jgi:hypothetical protein
VIIKLKLSFVTTGVSGDSGIPGVPEIEIPEVTDVRSKLYC